MYTSPMSEARKHMLSPLHVQDRWTYKLQGFNLKMNQQLLYSIEDDKDTVQDQLVGRAERGYWRPLTKPLPEPVRRGCSYHKADQLLVVDASGSSGLGKQGGGGGKQGGGDQGGEGEKTAAAKGRQLASSPGRHQKRTEAANAQEVQARKMQKKAAEKQGLGELAIGTVVQLRKEDVDRAKLDSPSATLVVLARTDDDNYVVGNKAGVYKEYVSRSYLTPVPHATAEVVGLEAILADYTDPEKRGLLARVGIRAIAAADSPAGRRNSVGWCVWDGVGWYRMVWDGVGWCVWDGL